MTSTYRVEFTAIRSYFTPQMWTGRPSYARLVDLVKSLDEQGDIREARIVRQSTGETVATYAAPAFTSPFTAAW